MNERACHRVALRGNQEFKIVIDPADHDPITQSVREGTWTFPPLFELGFALTQPGDALLDLGAHIGTFALGAAALGRRVVAVEASPRNAGLLKESAAQNSFEHLRIVSAAVSDRAGTIEFHEGGPYGMIANPYIESIELPTTQVPAVVVDELLEEIGWDRVDLIKMDVEGSEIPALCGMARLLGRANAPPILYESNGHTLSLFGRTPEQLLKTLVEFGYENYLVEPGRLIALAPDHLQIDCNVDHLAVKPPFEVPPGWRIFPPRDLEKTTAQIIAACAHPHEHHRAYTAHALAAADSRVLSNREVRRALGSLKHDPHPDVRAAAAWVADTLPTLPAEEDGQPPPRAPSTPGRQGVGLRALADEVAEASDVALRGYVVRSEAPLMGPLIAWVRRNATSHLREPYLDPIVERQVAVNRRTAEWLQRAAEALDAATRHQADLESRLRDLETEIDALRRRLEGEAEHE